MKFILILLSLWFIKPELNPATFREKQLNYTRVREAYSCKEKIVVKSLKEHAISRDSLRLYMRAFKTEKKIELWGKNICDSTYTLIKEIPMCEISGEIGPKRRSYDLQVPEGFYHINELNPYSKYYLSMKINYPNPSDSIRGRKGHLGNLIYIHGGCESSGCISINDERIKELFIYCIEAYNAGQKEIDITIYPAKLEDKTYGRLTKENARNKDKISLWADLKKSYDLFSLKKVPPTVKYLPDGTHEISFSPEATEQSSGNALPGTIQGPAIGH
ncbi:MAG TPA: L,D-transpeptidase family protein [Prolixibacteraceae bacterium]|nr:L,D-transpeptidase family protein [Prolixibacteraceae bacterium]